jgi:hypothetical protein
MHAHGGTHTYWINHSSPANITLNRQISNVPVVELIGALQLYSPTDVRAKSVKINSLSVVSEMSTPGTWQLHSSRVSALSALMVVVSWNQLSENGGLNICLQVSVAPSPAGIASGMPGPTRGWMVNSVGANGCVKREEDMGRKRGRGERGGGEKNRCWDIPYLQHLIPSFWSNKKPISMFFGQQCFFQTQILILTRQKALATRASIVACICVHDRHLTYDHSSAAARVAHWHTAVPNNKIALSEKTSSSVPKRCRRDSANQITRKLLLSCLFIFSLRSSRTNNSTALFCCAQVESSLATITLAMEWSHKEKWRQWTIFTALEGRRLVRQILTERADEFESVRPLPFLFVYGTATGHTSIQK